MRPPAVEGPGVFSGKYFAKNTCGTTDSRTVQQRTPKATPAGRRGFRDGGERVTVSYEAAAASFIFVVLVYPSLRCVTGTDHERFALLV